MKKILKNISIILVATLIIINLTGCVNNKNIENEDDEVSNKENEEIDLQISKALQESSLFWQNPDEKYLEDIYITGMMGNTLQFKNDNTFVLYYGNGGWFEGDYKVENKIIKCNITKSNSEWHKEAETLNEPVTFYMESNLEFYGITEFTITYLSNNFIKRHSVNMMTGKLENEEKESEVIQLKKGNVYSSWEGGLNEDGLPRSYIK